MRLTTSPLFFFQFSLCKASVDSFDSSIALWLWSRINKRKTASKQMLNDCTLCQLSQLWTSLLESHKSSLQSHTGPLPMPRALSSHVRILWVTGKSAERARATPADKGQQPWLAATAHFAWIADCLWRHLHQQSCCCTMHFGFGPWGLSLSQLCLRQKSSPERKKSGKQLCWNCRMVGTSSDVQEKLTSFSWLGWATFCQHHVVRWISALWGQEFLDFHGSFLMRHVRRLNWSGRRSCRS